MGRAGERATISLAPAPARRLAPSVAIVVLFAPSLAAAIWPEPLGSFHRVSAQPVTPSADQAIWREYGFQQGESAQYESNGQKFTATAYRFQDPTGGLAAFEWLRPADAKPSGIAKEAVDTADGSILLHGNYVLRFDGYRPQTVLLDTVILGLTQVDTSALPPLLDYLPAQNLVPNSERYVVGPAALEKFYPGIPPATAAFHLGGEAQLGAFHAPGGDMKLAIFDYPTPQIAMQQSGQFGKIPGAMAKRSGTLVAVILAPPDANAAEKLLSLIRYQGTVTLNERIPTRRDNIGNLVINTFVLIGILLCFSLVGGLAFGGFRAFLRRGGRGEAADAMIVLHLQDRSTSTREP